jgi:transposase InsO family protein
VLKGVPEHIRSDNGPEFVAKDLRKWLADTAAKTLYIEPGSPWENGILPEFSKFDSLLGRAGELLVSFVTSSCLYK